MGQTPMGPNHEYLSPSITYLWPHHRKMARLAAAGLTPGEIANITGFSAGQISRIFGTPMFQIERARIEAMADEVAVDLRQDIQMMGIRATEILDEDLNMEINNRFERKLRQDAAKDVLDRAGYRKQNEPSVHLHKHLHKEVKEMSTEDLRESVFDLAKAE